MPKPPTIDFPTLLQRMGKDANILQVLPIAISKQNRALFMQMVANLHGKQISPSTIDFGIHAQTLIDVWAGVKPHQMPFKAFEISEWVYSRLIGFVPLERKLDVLLPILNADVITHGLSKQGNLTLYCFGTSYLEQIESVGSDIFHYSGPQRFDLTIGAFTEQYMAMCYQSYHLLRPNGIGIYLVPNTWKSLSTNEDVTFRNWLSKLDIEVYNLEQRPNDPEPNVYKNYGILILRKPNNL